MEHPSGTPDPLRCRARLPERRGPAERFAAWLFTGPLGHLYGVLADLTMHWAHHARERVRARERQ